MYYKLTNKQSEVYKKLHELRTKELRIERENKHAVDNKIQLEYDGVYGRKGQQHFERVPTYKGFGFTDAKKIDPKIWKWNETAEGYLPNHRTNAGREMRTFLNNLETSSLFALFKIIGYEIPGRFTYPYLEICGEIIIIYLDKNYEPKDENFIEITSKEFHEILNNYFETIEK